MAVEERERRGEAIRKVEMIEERLPKGDKEQDVKKSGQGRRTGAKKSEKREEEDEKEG